MEAQFFIRNALPMSRWLHYSIFAIKFRENAHTHTQSKWIIALHITRRDESNLPLDTWCTRSDSRVSSRYKYKRHARLRELFAFDAIACALFLGSCGFPHKDDRIESGTQPHTIWIRNELNFKSHLCVPDILNFYCNLYASLKIYK